MERVPELDRDPLWLRLWLRLCVTLPVNETLGVGASELEALALGVPLLVSVPVAVPVGCWLRVAELLVEYVET